jgi:hypothetical protein
MADAWFKGSSSRPEWVDKHRSAAVGTLRRGVSVPSIQGPLRNAPVRRAHRCPAPVHRANGSGCGDVTICNQTESSRFAAIKGLASATSSLRLPTHTSRIISSNVWERNAVAPAGDQSGNSMWGFPLQTKWCDPDRHMHSRLNRDARSGRDRLDHSTKAVAPPIVLASRSRLTATGALQSANSAIKLGP